MQHLARAHHLWSLLVVLVVAIACGGDDGPRARWTFEIGPFAAPGAPPPPAVAPAELAELPEQVLQRLPEELRRSTSVRFEGERTLVVEGPLELDRTPTEVEAALGGALQPADRELRLVPPPGKPKDFLSTGIAIESVDAFPSGAGVVQIGSEWIAFARREDTRLLELERGAFGSTAAVHPAGEPVHLVASDGLARLLGRSGSLRFLVAGDCARLGTAIDLSAARARLLAWLASHPGATLLEYDTVPLTDGGPPPGTVWRANRDARPLEERAHLLRVPDPPFTERDLHRIETSADTWGLPAVAIELAKKRQEEFGDLTESIIGCGLAIVIDEEIRTRPVVKSRLSGSFVIEGGGAGFTHREVEDLIHSLRAGPLAAPLRLVKREEHGARALPR